jgi:glycosyltransferase involved in cell wall biosynthesis
VRILYVVEQYLEEGSRFYRDLFRILRDEGAEIHVVNLASSDSFDLDVGPFVSAIESFALTDGYGPSIRLLRSIFSRLAPDLIHSMEIIPAYYSAKALRGTSRDVALVYGRHHERTFGLKSRVMDMFAFWGADRIVAVSAAMARVARSEHPFGARKVMHIHNGITAMGRAEPGDEPPPDLLRDLSGAFVILFLGRLREKKGHRVAFEAAARFSDVCPDCVMLVVGEGPIEDDLKGHLSKMNLEGRVRFLGGVRDISWLMELADVMIVPSLTEAFGLVAIEGMEFGLPVVASDVGGLSEILTHRRTGILVPPGSPERLAETLEELWRKPELRRALGVAAQREYQERFTPRVMAMGYLSLYRELVEVRALRSSARTN